MTRGVCRIDRLARRSCAWAHRLGLFIAVLSFVCVMGLAFGLATGQVVAQADIAMDVDSYDTIKSDTAGSDTTTDTTTPDTAASDNTKPDTSDPAAEEPEGTGSEDEGTEALPTAEVDVVVYATQTSGLAAARELALGAPHLRVALISCGNLLETPLRRGSA